MMIDDDDDGDVVWSDDENEWVDTVLWWLDELEKFFVMMDMVFGNTHMY